ncbi:hypothetical protein OVV49_33105, partial [Klebsiella pneumoniae]|nr:hypothetical protein [Klebsiella pneumoniae]
MFIYFSELLICQAEALHFSSLLKNISSQSITYLEFLVNLFLNISRFCSRSLYFANFADVVEIY